MSTVAEGQILTVAQMRSAEGALLRSGDTITSLMERAGCAAAQWVWQAAAGRAVTVLCGPGNNGGDGYVIARQLSALGGRVEVVAPMEPASGAAVDARASYTGTILNQEPGKSTRHGGVLVDCLFGSGLARPLADDHAALLSRLAAAHDLKIALDLPSGTASDSGALLNGALCVYDVTLALGAWKLAHWLMPGMAAMGKRVLIDIGVGRVAGAARLVARPDLAPPAFDAHKYSRGLLAVVGGAMPGAAALAARAAMRAGAGYVKLFAQHKTPAPDELVIEQGMLDASLDDGRIDAVLVGPGLGRDGEAATRLQAVLSADLPCVLDADALIMLEPEMLEGRKAPVVCTPHDGELHAMCGRFGIAADDRLQKIRSLAGATGATILAKGPDTVIAGPGGGIIIAPPASSWLSTAGTGDVLAGVVASRLATGAPADCAAEAAVWLHGEAARIAGPVLVASDLIDALPAAYAACL